MTGQALLQARILSDPVFRRLKDFVIDASGMAYYLNKDKDLATRLAQRMTVCEVSNCAAYLGLLQDQVSGDQELDQLVAELTIGETFFFRHREQFDALRDNAIPELLELRRDSRQLRIWSAGCSIGAEPYSISILLKEHFGPRLAGWDVSILATDINRKFLAQAGEGCFKDWALRSLEDAARNRYFIHSGSGWSIKPQFRAGVNFQCHNLARHPFPSMVNNLFAFDIILCRNVMMYFTREVMSRLVSQFRRTLLDGGWMLVGPSETDIEFFRPFRTVSVPGATLYQNSGEQSPRPEWAPPRIESGPYLAPAPPIPFIGYKPPDLARIQVPPIPAASHAPGDSSADLERFLSLLDAAKWQEALETCEKLIAANRIESVTHFYHGLVLEQLGKFSEAEQALRRAIYLDRNMALAHYHLGLFFQKRKQPLQAQRSFINTLQILERQEDAQTLQNSDGMTVHEMRELAQMQLEVVGGGV